MTFSEWNELVARTLLDGASHNFEIMVTDGVITQAWIDADQVIPADTRQWTPSVEMPEWEFLQVTKYRREYRRINPQTNVAPL